MESKPSFGRFLGWIFRIAEVVSIFDLILGGVAILKNSILYGFDKKSELMTSPETYVKKRLLLQVKISVLLLSILFFSFYIAPGLIFKYNLELYLSFEVKVMYQIVLINILVITPYSVIPGMVSLIKYLKLKAPL